MFLRVNEITNGTEVLPIEAAVEPYNAVENQSNNETNSPKRAKRIRKRKRKQASGTDVEIQEDSSKVKTVENNSTVDSKQLFSESKNLLKQLSIHSDGSELTTIISPVKSGKHIRSFAFIVKIINSLTQLYRFSDDNTTHYYDATSIDVTSSKITPTKQFDSLQPRVVRPSIVCMWGDC